MNYIKTLLEQISEFRKVAGCQSAYKNQLYFYRVAMNNINMKLRKHFQF